MPEVYLFSDFELDVEAYALFRAGERTPLERIPMEVLILLVRNAGTLIERTAIHSSVWGPDVFVDHDASINTAVRKIRQTLGDDAEEPRFVETVVGKGYRFTAPLSARGRPCVPSAYKLVRGRRHFELEGGENILGRDPTARVYIEHPSVSRRHARISIDRERVVLEDLVSRNGTFLEGRPIEEPTEIRNGATIGLGPITLTFFAVSEGASTQPMAGGPRREC